MPEVERLLGIQLEDSKQFQDSFHRAHLPYLVPNTGQNAVLNVQNAWWQKGLIWVTLEGLK